MYELYFDKSPNTYKIAIFFEAAGLEYRTRLVNVGEGEQFKPEFVAISPNSKVPVIRDLAPADGGPPLTVFESNCILLYLARKHKVLLPTDFREENEMMQWLFWQAACQGPFYGQSAHFTNFMPQVEYARERYQREARRLTQVLNDRLRGRDFVSGKTYTIADIACYCWMLPIKRFSLGVDLGLYPELTRWMEAIAARPEVAKGLQRLNNDDKRAFDPNDYERVVRHFLGLEGEAAKLAAENARRYFGAASGFST